MIFYLAIFAFAIIAGLGFTFLTRGIARRLNLVDTPDGARKLHEKPVPRIGGVAIFSALIAAGLFAYFIGKGIPASSALRLFIGASAIVLIGLWDDVKGLRARWKLLLLTLVAVAMYYMGTRITVISNPHGGQFNLGLLSLPVTVFWFLGCMNGINLIDGLDGLASGVALFACATIFAVAAMLGNAHEMIPALALAGVLAGFLVYNFQPASIFLGDSGSYLLGFMIACQGLQGQLKANTIFALLVPLIALGLPVIDTALAIVRRWSQGLSMFTSDHEHIHHRLLRAGYSHRQAVMLMYGVCLVLALTALIVAALNDRTAALFVLVVGVTMIAVVRLVGRSELKMLKQRVGHVYLDWRRARAVRTAGHQAIQKIGNAKSFDAAWDSFVEVAPEMNLVHAGLQIRMPDSLPQGKEISFSWTQAEKAHKNDELWSLKLPLCHQGEEIGTFSAACSVQNGCFTSATPETLDALGRAFIGSRSRISSSLANRVTGAYLPTLQQPPEVKERAVEQVQAGNG